MYYLLIFIFLITFVLLEQKGLECRSQRWLFIVAYLMLMTTAGFRYETGGDWTSYTGIFETVEPINEVISGNNSGYEYLALEPGYKILNSVTKWIADNVQLLFLIVALVISTLIFRGIKDYSPYPLMGVMLYYGLLFFSLDMIVLRQGLAVSILFYGYRYVEQRRFWHFLLVVALASMFHISAIMGLFIYLVCRKRYSTKFIIIITVVVSVIMMLQIKWVSPLMTMALSTQLDDVVANKILTYTTREAYATARVISFGYLITIVILGIVLLQRKRLEEQKYFNLFLNLLVLYILIYCSVGEIVEVSNRLKYYFMISFVVLIPMLLKSFSLIGNKCLMTGFAIFFAFMYCRAPVLQLPIAAAFNPYQSYIVYLISPFDSDGEERLEKSDEEFIKVRGK